MGVDIKGIGKTIGKKTISAGWRMGKVAFAASNPYARLFADMIPGMSFNMARKSAESSFDNNYPENGNVDNEVKESLDNTNENLDNLNSTLDEIHEMTLVINNALKNISDENSKNNKSSNKRLLDIHEMLLVINNTLKKTNDIIGDTNKNINESKQSDKSIEHLLEHIFKLLQPLSSDKNKSNFNKKSNEKLEEIHEMLLVINNTLKKKERTPSQSIKTPLEEIHEMLLVINNNLTNKQLKTNSRQIKNINKNNINNIYDILSDVNRTTTTNTARNLTNKAIADSTRYGTKLSLPKSKNDSSISDIHEMLLVINNTLLNLSGKLNRSSNKSTKKNSEDDYINMEDETADRSISNNVLKFKSEDRDFKFDNMSLDDICRILFEIDESLKQTNNNIIEALTNEEANPISIRLNDLLDKLTENNNNLFDLISINSSIEKFNKTKINKLVELDSASLNKLNAIKTLSSKSLKNFDKFIKEYKEKNKERKLFIKNGFSSINANLGNIVNILDRILEINEEMIIIDRERFTKEKSEEELRNEQRKKEKIKEQLKIKNQGEGLGVYIYKAIREAIISATKKTAIGALKLPFSIGWGAGKGIWNHIIKPIGEEGITNIKMNMDRKRSAVKNKYIDEYREAVEAGDSKKIRKLSKKLKKYGLDDISLDMIGKGSSEAEIKLFKERLDKKNKAVPFDYETKDAIVNAIPMLLSRIYNALSGEELIHNYEMGRLTSKDEYIESKQTAAKMRNLELSKSRKRRFLLFNKNSNKFYNDSLKSIAEINTAKSIAENQVGNRNLFGNTVKSVYELQSEKGFSDKEGLRKRFLSTAGISAVTSPYNYLKNNIKRFNDFNNTKNVNSIDYIKGVHEKANRNHLADLSLSSNFNNEGWLERLYRYLVEDKLAVSIINKKDKQKQENLLRGSSSFYFGDQLKSANEKKQQKIESQNNKYLKQIAKSTTKHEKEFTGYYRWQKAKNIFNTILSIGSSIITSIGGIVSGLWDVGKYIVTGLATYLGFKAFNGNKMPGGKNRRTAKNRRGGKIGLMLGAAGLAASVAGMNNMFGDDIDENGEPTTTAKVMNTANTALGAYSAYQLGKGAYEAINGTKGVVNAGSQVAEASSKMAGNSAKLGSKGFLKGSSKIAGNVLRAIPGLGWALGAGMSLADGWSSATDDEAIKMQTGKSNVGMYDRIKHGLGGAAAGLINWIPGLGDVSSTSVVNTGEKLVNFLSGKGWNTDKERLEDPSKEGSPLSKVVSWVNPIGIGNKITDWFSKKKSGDTTDSNSEPKEMIDRIGESNDISANILLETQNSNYLLKEIARRMNPNLPSIKESNYSYKMSVNGNKNNNNNIVPLTDFNKEINISTTNPYIDKETTNILTESNIISSRILNVLESIDANTKANLKKVNDKVIINNNKSYNTSINEQEAKIVKSKIEDKKKISVSASNEAKRFANT